MKKNIIYSIVVIGTLFVLGCGGSDSGGGNDDNPMAGNDDPDPIPDPSSATLVFPADNTECNTGVVDPSNETLSTVTFEWNASQNTDSYTTTVVNLNTLTSIRANSTTAEIDITIQRGVPFEWFVTSRAEGTAATAVSETFRFYNEGPGIENYAPFPAEAVNPTRGANIPATGIVTLEWSTSDLDDDITEYEVFFGTDANPTTSLGTTSDSSFPDVEIVSGETYYWKIITTDSAGNTSTSEIFQFRVN